MAADRIRSWYYQCEWKESHFAPSIPEHCQSWNFSQNWFRLPHLAACEKKLLDCSTMYSQAVTHPSTNMAQCCLTSVIGRELVFSTWYGRRQNQDLQLSMWIKRKPLGAIYPRQKLVQKFSHNWYRRPHLPASRKKLLDCSTMYSQAVTHPSTNMAQCCLTSVIGQELVFSTW